MPQLVEAPLLYVPTEHMFDCPRHHARIDERSCGRLWERARRVPKSSSNSIVKCRGCPIGRANAGHAPAPTAVQANELSVRICTRCSQGGAKFTIFGTLCVSCFNRQREALVGVNRRGNRPMASLRGVPERWQQEPVRKPRAQVVIVGIQRTNGDMVARRRVIDRVVNGVEIAYRVTRQFIEPELRQAAAGAVFGFAYPKAGLVRL